MGELVKHERILDKIYTIVGDGTTDVILNGKGNVKVRFGNSFLNLIKNGKIDVTFPPIINEVTSASDIKSDGIYFTKDEGQFYIKYGNSLINLSIQGEGGSIEGFLSYNNKQSLTEDQIKLVLGNLKQILNYKTDDSVELPINYPYFIISEGRHFLKTANGFEEIYLNLKDGGVVKGNVTFGDSKNPILNSKINIIGEDLVSLYNNSILFKLKLVEDSLGIYYNNEESPKIELSEENLNINVNTNISGDLYVDNRIETSVNGGITTSNVESYDFSPGIDGSGYSIYEDGGKYTLEIDSILVRDDLNIPELTLEKARSIRGATVMSQGSAIIKGISIIEEMEFEEVDENYIKTGNLVNVDVYELTFNEEFLPFTKNDLVRCKSLKYPRSKDYIVWIRDVIDSKVYIDIDQFSKYPNPDEDEDIPSEDEDEEDESPTVIEDISGMIEVGDELCQFGNVVDINRQNIIYLSAFDSNKPIVEILEEVNNTEYSEDSKCKFGDLSNSIYRGLSLKNECGLYSNNSYIIGRSSVYGHNKSNLVDVGNFIEANSINISKAHLLKEFITNEDSDCLAFYNGDYSPGEKRIIKNPEYVVPDMRSEDYNYDTDPNKKMDPTYSDNFPDRPPMYIEKVMEIPSGGASLNVYNYTKNGSTTCYIDGSVVTTYPSPKDPEDPTYIEVDLVPLQISICNSLKILGSNGTLYFSKNVPKGPYAVGDFWMNYDYEILVCNSSIELTKEEIEEGITSKPGNVSDWERFNTIQTGLREDFASKIGYLGYIDMVSWATSNRMIIKNGYINPRILEADIYIGSKLPEGDYMRSSKIEIKAISGEDIITKWRFSEEGITGGIELVESTSLDGVVTTVERPHVKFLPDGTMYGLRMSDDNNNPWRFNNDGSGLLAYNNLYWNSDGDVTMLAPKSGITASKDQGSLSGDDLVRYWAGGTLESAMNTVLNNLNGTSDTPIAPFVVTQGGKLFVNGDVINGAFQINVGDYIGDILLSDFSYEIFDPDRSSEGDRYRDGLAMGKVKTSISSQSIFGLVFGTKDTVSNYWYNQDSFFGRLNGSLVGVFNNLQVSNECILSGKTIIKDLSLTKAISVTIISGDSDNPYPLNLDGISYIEINSNDTTRNVSLNGGRIGQVCYIYNTNTYGSHRIEIMLMNGWFWLIEQRAAGFIYTSEGWRLIKGRMGDD